ncbi:MAG TPA: hypothetical protein PK720_02255 [bacterium]|nr:hypothetical protein [bacterium]
MSIIKPRSLEEIIIDCLKQGEKESPSLLYEVQTIRTHITKQGFYAALRKLRKEEVVTVRKKMVSLNTSWIRDLQLVVDNMNSAYLGENASFGLLSLNDKESASFVFSTTVALDVFWGHSQNIFFYNTSVETPIYCYDPHYWIYVARKETEQKLLEDIAKNNRQFLIVVGGDTPLDHLTKKDFNDNFVQYHIEKLYEKNNYYFTVIGDYITEVYMNEQTTKKIEELYMEHTTVNPELLKEFNKLLVDKRKHRIKISRNASKAEEMKKKLRKYFYIIK